MPPLNLRIMIPEKEKKNNNLTVYASYKEIEPSEDKHDLAWVPLKRSNINISGERGPKPNIKVFASNIIYFTFISSTFIEHTFIPIYNNPTFFVK